MKAVDLPSTGLNGNHSPIGAPAPILITGGAGFIGSNLAARLAESGRRVIVYDNLSRAGVEHNAAWLRRAFAGLIDVRIEDVCDRAALRASVREAGAIFHFAAQVAVTTSLVAPEEDLRTNILGTFGLLEELRALDRPVPLLFTSTNKVYGNLAGRRFERTGDRYYPLDDQLRRHGVDERQGLDFHSPYGCSKGAADQYILDYARSYRMPAAVFRMSCIYGQRQCGNEDQGWVAHIIRMAIEGRPITIFGDGAQVRDLLFADDLVSAFTLALGAFDRVSGRVFNVGGGAAHSVSLLELIDMLRQRGLDPDVRYADWRQGDQRWYISDARALRRALGWRPAIGVAEGVDRLIEWLRVSPAISSAISPATNGTQHTRRPEVARP